MFTSLRKTPIDIRPLISPSPTPVPVELQDVISPDGKIKLIMETQRHGNSSATYSVFISKISGEGKLDLFTTTTDTETFSLPHNSWSPNGKLVFIKKDKPGELTFLVFKTTGETFQKDQSLNVGELFAKKQPKYILTDATGWASETLLIITTATAADKSKPGPSFWFDIPSKTFIQLWR